MSETKNNMKSLQRIQKIGFLISVLAFLALSGTKVALASASKGLNYTTIDVPGAVLTAGQGINASGDFVGFFNDTAGFSHGFLFAKGKFSFFDVPGQLETAGRGINALGDIVGETDNGVTTRGYLFSRNGFSFIDFPGAVETDPSAINAFGDIVGFYFDSGG